ncbi:MAG: PilZ domain-containing protein [Planctomycetota bacterium]
MSVAAMTTCPTGLLAALDAAERLDAARDLSQGTTDWLWVALWAALGLLAGASLAMLLYSRRAAAGRNARALARQATRLGLSDEETRTVRRIARAAKLADPVAMLTSRDALTRAVARYLDSRAYAELPADQQERVLAHIESLCEKLPIDAGHRPTGSTGQEHADPLTAGGHVSVVHRGRAGGCEGTIRAVSERELVIESDAANEDAVGPGESWLVRYPAGGTIWEFESTVLRRERNRFVLNRPETFRYINRRRFPRVPTDKPAQLADVSHLASIESADAPQFVPGNLVEIAGPGLLLTTDLQARVGQNLLTVVHLDAERKSRAVGSVRRVLPHSSGRTLLAVELTGLDDEQLAALARATNAAARDAAQPAASTTT